MIKVSAIVLAAGRSRRMGPENKLLLPINGKPMIHRVIASVQASLAHEVIVVASQMTTIVHPGVQVVMNLHPESGMTSSIQLGIRACTSGTAGYMICLGDMPLIPTEVYNCLIEAFDQQVSREQILVPTFGGQRGNPILFSKDFKQKMLTHTEPDGCRHIVRDHRDCVVNVPIDNSSIQRDFDTPEDLKGV